MPGCCCGCAGGAACACGAAVAFSPVIFAAGIHHEDEEEYAFTGRLLFDFYPARRETDKHLFGLVRSTSVLEPYTPQQAEEKMREFFCKNGYRKVVSIEVDGEKVYAHEDDSSGAQADDLAEAFQELRGFLSRRNDPASVIRMIALSKDGEMHYSTMVTYRPAHADDRHGIVVEVDAIPNVLFPAEGESKDDAEKRIGELTASLKDYVTPYKDYKAKYLPVVRAKMESYRAFWSAMGTSTISSDVRFNTDY